MKINLIDLGQLADIYVESTKCETTHIADFCINEIEHPTLGKVTSIQGGGGSCLLLANQQSNKSIEILQ